jgi:hypothetical protein
MGFRLKLARNFLMATRTFFDLYLQGGTHEISR